MVEMTISKALNILIQAAEIGQKSGCYNLDEARVIADAKDMIIGNTGKKPTQTAPTQPTQASTQKEKIPNIYDDKQVTLMKESVKQPHKYMDPTIPKKATSAEVKVQQDAGKKAPILGTVSNIESNNYHTGGPNSHIPDDKKSDYIPDSEEEEKVVMPPLPNREDLKQRGLGRKRR